MFRNLLTINTTPVSKEEYFVSKAKLSTSIKIDLKLIIVLDSFDSNQYYISTPERYLPNNSIVFI